MSMISAQIDELRELVGDGSMEWVAGPVRASVLREAADTIWQLRDDLQRTHGLLDDAEHDESRAWDRVRRAEAEADRLRELAWQMYPKAKAFLQMGVRLGCNDTLSYDWYLQLRELGVEVDE